MGDIDEEHNILERILAGIEDPTNLPLAILESITENFSKERKIGDGGFGEVYKVKLSYIPSFYQLVVWFIDLLRSYMD